MLWVNEHIKNAMDFLIDARFKNAVLITSAQRRYVFEIQGSRLTASFDETINNTAWQLHLSMPKKEILYLGNMQADSNSNTDEIKHRLMKALDRKRQHKLQKMMQALGGMALLTKEEFLIARTYPTNDRLVVYLPWKSKPPITLYLHPLDAERINNILETTFYANTSGYAQVGANILTIKPPTSHHEHLNYLNCAQKWLSRSCKAIFQKV